MASRLISVHRPEGGDEHGVVWTLHHGCPVGRALKSIEGEDVDILVFGVGQAGYGMPLDTPFDVVSADSCRACGAWVRSWFQWTGPRIFLP